MDEQHNRWRAWFDSALLAGALAAALVAVGIVVALFWWVSDMPQGPSASIAVRRQPVRPPAPAAQSARRNAAAPPPVAATKPAPAQVAAQPLAAQPAAAPPPPAPVEAPTYGPNSDGEKNRAIGKSLSRLAHDPNLQRRLGIELPP